MSLPIRVIAFHPVVANYLTRILGSNSKLDRLLSSRPITDLKLLPQHNEPRLFVVDAFFLPLELSALVRLLRVRCPGSKFLVLVGREQGGNDEMLRLMHLGIDGIELLSGDWEEKLAAAVEAVLNGGVWAPPRVLAEYQRQTKLLVNHQLFPHLSLTGRENQILQFTVRRFSNQEIADALGITERTVRFHISNIFRKLQIEDRRGLFAALENLKHKLA